MNKMLAVALAVCAIWAGAQDLAVTHPISERKGIHENQDWFEFRGFHYTDAKKDLPRVFLLGDSISGGYRKGVQERLEGLANVTWFTSCYCVTTPNYIKLLELYLDDADYAVIHINNGGHSLQADLRAYETKLGEALRLIRRKQPKAKLVWANTTPSANEEHNRRILELNAIAEQVAKAVGVDGTDDLYAAMMSAPADRRWSDGCHPKPDALRALVASVVRSVHPHLGVKPDVAPTKGQLDRLEDGITAIIHFGLNTFADKKWGFGDMSPAAFNPTKLDTDQWTDAMAAAGIRRVVMVTKHHDGFNLWPSAHNPDYTVANSPWKNGKGDVVGMIKDSCLRKRMRFGVYLSPWDRHQASRATPAYTDYYHRQFEELFTKYGPISEIWLDDVNSGEGWYGGAKESRKLSGESWDYYRIPQVLKRMHELYPDAIAFGGEGINSAIWVGNEAGCAPMAVEYVTKRGCWKVPECVTPLRKDCFWHANDAPKPLSQLVDIYCSSVGRGCVLNLGIAPNREGLVGADDVRRLKEFGDWVRKFNAVDLAQGATVWSFPGIYQIDLQKPTAVDAVDVREDLSFGQKTKAWKFEYDKDGVWTPVVESATIGYRRIERFAEVTSRRFRVVVTESKPGVSIDSVALRHTDTVPLEPDAAPLRKYFASECVGFSDGSVNHGGSYGERFDPALTNSFLKLDLQNGFFKPFRERTAREASAVTSTGADSWRLFDRRLGMFVHWGIYAADGWHEQQRMRLGMDRAEYEKRAVSFAAERFDAGGLVAVAKSLGADYIVFTSKHHDGFCMWDTQTTDFKVTNTPCGRDVLRELAEACKQERIKLGLYYSNPDWHHPNAYNPRSSHQVPPEKGDEPDMEKYRAYVRAQVTELLTNYGEIVCFFWDIPTEIEDPEMNALVRRLQPSIKINDRGWGAKGDYSTPEREVPEGSLFPRPTEACDSVGADSWGYRANEDYRTVGYLTRSIDAILSMGGNYLLNVGPKSDGTIPAESLDLLSKTGDWYGRVRESYRDVETVTNLVSDASCFTTVRGKTVYLHYPNGLTRRGLDLSPLTQLPKSATLLNTGKALACEVVPMPGSVERLKRPCLHVTDIPADELANESVVVRLVFDGEVLGF